MTAAENMIAIREKTIMDRPRTDPDRSRSAFFSIFFAAGQIKNKPADRSNAPVQRTGPTHRSNAPVQRTGPTHRSNAPVQRTGPTHRSSTGQQRDWSRPVQISCTPNRL